MKLTSKVLATTLVVLSLAVAGIARTQVTWNNVTAFAGANATYIHPNVIADMQAEKAAGVKTWTVFGSEPSAGKKGLDLKGTGWPATGVYIQFDTAAEASICGSMIDAIPTDSSK